MAKYSMSDPAYNPKAKPRSGSASPELVDLSKRFAPGSTTGAAPAPKEPTLADRYATDREAIDSNPAYNVEKPKYGNIREQYRQEAQGSVDAIRSTFDKYIAEDTEAKRKLESKAYLSTLASGLTASPTGAGQTTAAAEKGEEKVRATIAERDTKIQEVLSAADLRASNEFNSRRTEYIESATDRAAAEETLRQRINDTALGELELLASSGSYDEISKGSPARMEQYMKETGLDETGLRAYFLSKKKSNLINEKPEIIGNKAVWFSQDPATGKISKETVDLPDVGKEIEDSRITDAGIQVLYKDGTYEVLGGSVGGGGGGGNGDADKLLTVAEAKSLGVPYGTTRGQAYGTTAPSTVKETQSEKNNLGFYLRGKDAVDTISTLEEKIRGKDLAAQARLEFAPNWVQSEENQVYRQLQRQFTEARLRKESGAAIPPAEYDSDAKTYFAQPGDTVEVLKRKEAARAVVLESLRLGAGNAFKNYQGGGSTDETRSNILVDTDGNQVDASDLTDEEYQEAINDGYQPQ